MTYRWAADRLGIELIDASDAGARLDSLVGVAVRRNARRAHLLVSTVLGKHIPADPRVVLSSAQRLGWLVSDRIDTDADALVLGYAETATGLGHVVAATLAAEYLHSTRRDIGMTPVISFDEAHSHAPRHLLLPERPELLTGPGPVVLVDDELSTGRTALNTIRALQSHAPRNHYVIAALVDVRDARAQDELAATARELGVRIETVALASGRVHLPDGCDERAAQLAATVSGVPVRDVDTRARAAGTSRLWPDGVRESGRHGFGVADVVAARSAARDTAAGIVADLAGDRVLVLGTEELMYAPLLLALELQKATTSVRFSSTTRSPVVVLDEPGYPIRTAVTFASSDESADAPGPRFAYNVAPSAGAVRFTDIVLVTDEDSDRPALWADDGPVVQLTAECARVHVVIVPTFRPAFVAATR